MQPFVTVGASTITNTDEVKDNFYNYLVIHLQYQVHTSLSFLATLMSELVQTRRRGRGYGL